ncbi:hypothetical protein [Streptomyces lydicus]|uniref:hypothetical protein n=1 Tax=Streptomyces lydicus TaxID=47763 RepID=UPI0013E94122|nr:hypothetical protein [Streptomyces lydicus]
MGCGGAATGADGGDDEEDGDGGTETVTVISPADPEKRARRPVPGRGLGALLVLPQIP